MPDPQSLMAWWPVYLIGINLTALGAFGYDKLQARNGGWRLSEALLLSLALAGGWIGAKVGQRRFRHKTSKQPFRTVLNLIPMAWLVLALLMISPGPSLALLAALAR